MIVRCPECSTGFKLPKEKITTKGVKLRCSKCSHVFRIRSTDDGDTEIFYTDADGGPPESDSDDEVVSDSKGSKTQFGMPNVNKGEQDSGPVAGAGGAAAASADEDADEESEEEEDVDEAAASRSAQPDYNPFPHAGDSIKPKKESRFQSSSAKLEEDASDDEDDGEEASDEPPGDAQAEQQEEGIDLFDDDEDEELEVEEDPFEGAFDEDAISGDSEKTMQAAGPAATKDKKEQQREAATASDDEASQQPASQPAKKDQGRQASGQADATQQGPEMDEVPTDDDSAFWSQQQESGFGSAEDMVDPSFGEDGAYFDAQQGKVDQGPKKPKGTEKGPPGGGPGQPSRAPAKSPQQGGASARGQQQTGDGGGGGQAKSPSTGSANKKTSWDVEQPIEPHTVGGSGMQKAANFLLITLIVVGLFFAVLAAMADGFIDFKRLPHTLEVAFQGEDFEPRDGWIPERPKVEKAPVEDPIRFQGVVGNVLDSDEGQMLAIRGRVKNVDETPYEGVRVRAMLQDANGRVVTEQEAYVGKRLSLDDVLAVESTDELQQMMPKQSPNVEPNASQPFTIVFPKIPERLQKSADLSYKVEMAAGDPVGGTEDSGAE
jgi:predicted Zn finger-like uncharacterized protein